MKTKLAFLILLLAVLLAACSSSAGPEQIATYPNEAPIAVAPRYPDSTVVYNATLDLEVSNVERAAERAKEIAFEQNGYLVSSQSWYQDGEKHMNLVLSVPAVRFDDTREALLRLGSVVGEWISSELTNNQGDYRETYSQITLYLHPKTSAFPQISLPEWRPIRTFENAWKVFISIFSFLLDIVIWITVVTGPFVLIGWGIKRLIQWWQKKG
jgi:hypothetical protein